MAISWRVTVAPGAGEVVDEPSTVWRAVTVIVCPGETTGGIWASWLRRTGVCPSCGDIWLPHVNAGFFVRTAKAGEVDAEYWVRMYGRIADYARPVLADERDRRVVAGSCLSPVHWSYR